MEPTLGLGWLVLVVAGIAFAWIRYTSRDPGTKTHEPVLQLTRLVPLIYAVLFLTLAFTPARSWLAWLTPPAKSTLTTIEFRQAPAGRLGVGWNCPGPILHPVERYYRHFSVYAYEPNRRAFLAELASIPNGDCSHVRSKLAGEGDRWALVVNDRDHIWSLAVNDDPIFQFDDRLAVLNRKAKLDSVTFSLVFFLLLLIPRALRALSSTVLPDPSMPLATLYFAFDKSRISRSVYWMYGVFPLLIANIVLIFFKFMHTPFHLDDQILIPPFFVGGTFTPTLTILSLILTWNFWALAVKRSRDRGRTPWFVLLALVPVLNLWFLVEVLLLKGRKRTTVGGLTVDTRT